MADTRSAMDWKSMVRMVPGGGIDVGLVWMGRGSVVGGVAYLE